MNPPKLPYDPQVDTFGSKILSFDSSELTYEEAYQNPQLVDKALGLGMKDNSNDDMPIEFTQFVLRKMAVQEKTCKSFAEALHSKARQYLMTLVNSTQSESIQVHPANENEEPSTFRGLFTRIFCRKVVMNLHNKQDQRFDEFARVFPFQVRRSVPDYEIRVFECFDDSFYNAIQSFLNDHFDDVDVREVTALFLSNVRHFFKTHSSTDEYLSTFPRLNEKGIRRILSMYKEYRNVRNHFNNYRNTPRLYHDADYFRTLPEKNIDDLSSLLRTIDFRTKRTAYEKIFKKYLFFFVHSLHAEHPNSVFFIDDMLYQCLKSLHKYNTVNEDINLVNHIAMVSLLDSLSPYEKCRLGSDDKYVISLTALQNMKTYITKLISEKDTQLNVEFETDGLIGSMRFRIGDSYFYTQYTSNNKANSKKGIKKFPERLICSALFPGDNPIKYIIGYNAFTGVETRFTMPEDDVQIQSLKNFIRLSNKRHVSGESAANQVDEDFSKFFTNCLVVSE